MLKLLSGAEGADYYIYINMYIWVVVKIMVPFWIPIIVRHLIYRVPQKGTMILTTAYTEIRIDMSFMWTTECFLLLWLPRSGHPYYLDRLRVISQGTDLWYLGRCLRWLYRCFQHNLTKLPVAGASGAYVVNPTLKHVKPGTGACRATSDSSST